MVRALAMCQAPVKSKPKVQKVELPPIDMRLEGPATYLGWSRQVRYILEGKDLEGYLTGEKEEPGKTAPERAEWKSTHMQVYIWLLSSLSLSIAFTVDGIVKVQDVWEKLRTTYDGVGKNLWVYQIKRKITAMVQEEKTVQEYAIELDRLWLDLGHFRRAAILLAQNRIPSLKEAVSTMMQEESGIRLQAGAAGLPEPKSALAANLGNTGYRGETRQCYNCGEVGHLMQACLKPPKKRDAGGRGQVGGRVHGRGVEKMKKKATGHI
ncbi:uncharacterized protein LOC144568686 [Carex rostrata]